MPTSDVPKEDVEAQRQERMAELVESQRIRAEANRAKAKAEQEAFGEGDKG